MNDTPSNQQPVWIGFDWLTDAAPFGDRCIAFRKDIELSGEIGRATLRICAFARYVLWINGKRAAAGPARCYPDRALYDELDVGAYFKPGRNCLAVIVRCPSGATGYAPVSRIGLKIDGQVECGSQRTAIVTDATWRVRSADWYRRSGCFISLPVGFQEHLQAPSEPADWRTRPPDDSWQPAHYIGTVLMTPSERWDRRPIDLLIEQPITSRLVWQGRTSDELHQPADNLAAAFNDMMVDGRAIEPRSADQWIESGADNVFVFDFGRTRLVLPRLEVNRAHADNRLELYYDLSVTDRPTAMRGFGQAHEGACDSYQPPATDATWQALAPRGFRFMTVRVTGPSGCRFRPCSQTVDYPYRPAAQLTSDDERLEAIWRISADTLRSDSSDVITDTCSREHVLWTFDACVAGKAAFYTFGETRLWRHCLVLIGQGVDDSGMASAVVPAERSFMCLLDQTMAWVASCWDYYMATGDATLIAEVAPPIDRFLTFCSSHVADEGLFVPPDYTWHWIDWAAMDHRAYSMPVNAMLLMAARAAERVGRAANDAALRRTARTLRTTLSAALPRFFDAQADCFADHVRPAAPNDTLPEPGWPADRLGQVAHSVHANTLAWWTATGDAAQRRAAVRFIAKAVEQPFGPPAKFGPGWTELILAPLFAYRRADAAIAAVRTLYGAMLDAGAPTWAEGFEPDPTPFNTAHGWGASVNTLIAEHLVGLRPLEPGWRSIELRPRPGSVRQLQLTIHPPTGPVNVEIDGKRIIATWPEGVELQYRRKRHLGTGQPVELP